MMQGERPGQPGFFRRIADLLGWTVAREGRTRAVTERARLEAGLRLSERNLADAQRIAHIGSWEETIGGAGHYWSAEMYRILGVDQATFAWTPDAFYPFVHADDRARVRGAERAMLEDGVPLRLDYRIVRPDGAVRSIHEEGEVILDPAGRPFRMVGTIQDVTDRLELEASERRLSEGQQIAGIGVWEWTAGSDVLTWSDENHRIFGLTPGEFGGTNEAFLALVHPDDRARAEEMDRLALDGMVPYDFDHRIVRPDGSVRIVHQDGTVIRDAAGNPVRMVGTVQDITERVAAEEERARLEEVLRLSRRNLAEAQRIARLGSWEWDAATDTSIWSDETCRIYGIEPGTFDGTSATFLAFVHPDDRPGLLAAVQAALEDGSPLGLDFRIVRPDGTVRILHEDGEVIPDAAGRPVRIVGTVQDITERVAAEQERARLASAVEQTADSILIQDTAGTITYVNPSFTRLYGYGSDEVVGRYAGLLDSGHHGPAFWSALWASVATGQVWSGSIVNRRRDGTLFEVEAVISAIHDAEGRLTSFVQTDRDVARERALEEQLRQSQKMEAIGQLAGGIAHDFNNILTAIRGYGELALDPDADERQRRADIEEVIASAGRAAELTRGLLAFSRRQVLQPRVVDPAAIVDGITPMLRRLIGEHIRLTTSAEPGLGQVKVDPSQLEQVVVNLAVNARDAMPAGGTLMIETANVELDDEYAATHLEASAGPYVLLAVSDTGIGMDEATQAHAFEPFFTTKAPGEGTGLGLSTVYGIVRQSGGSISLYSAPGHGTSFKIYLPLAEAAGSPAPVEPIPASPGGTETILLVEDEPAVRNFARRVLAAAGYTVLEAPDAEAALALAATHPGPIELLVTDVVMPRVSGPELARRLTAERPAIRVLYVSGYAEGHFGRSGTLSADTRYLPKPFTTEALTRAVRDVFDEGR